MRARHVGIQIDAQTRLLGDPHAPIFYISAVEHEQIIEPVAVARDRFAGDKVADRAGPLAGRPRIEL